MKISSDQIPQADMLKDIVKTIDGVSNGARTFSEIARVINKVDRQGRYYRKAAEILGFIENSNNVSNLTDAGKEFIRLSDNEKSNALIKAILSTQIFQRMIPFLETHPEGVSSSALIQFLTEVADLGGPTMAPRRISTLRNWLITTNLVTETNNRLFINRPTINSGSILNFYLQEPLIPHTYALHEYETVSLRLKKARDLVLFLRNQAKTDRANETHLHLVNLIASQIRKGGAIPKSNSMIDLATTLDNQSIIFEMKSVNSNNVQSQIRAGVSQLYEYRYLQANPTAQLVLAISDPLPDEKTWIIDYLENDRGIMLVWDGNESIYSTDRTANQLAFLWS
jgi:hypothetical protein